MASVERIENDWLWDAWRIAGEWHTAPLVMSALKRVDLEMD